MKNGRPEHWWETCRHDQTKINTCEKRLGLNNTYNQPLECSTAYTLESKTAAEQLRSTSCGLSILCPRCEALAAHDAASQLRTCYECSDVGIAQRCGNRTRNGRMSLHMLWHGMDCAAADASWSFYAWPAQKGAHDTKRTQQKGS